MQSSHAIAEIHTAFTFALVYCMCVYCVLVCPGRGSASGCPRQGPQRLGGGAGRGQPVRPRGASGRGPGGLKKGITYCIKKE